MLSFKWYYFLFTSQNYLILQVPFVVGSVVKQEDSSLLTLTVNKKGCWIWTPEYIIHLFHCWGEVELQVSQTILFPEYYSVFVVDLISTCDNPTNRLPCNWWTHVLPALLSNWLDKTFWINITFWRTNKQIHHFVSSGTFPSIFGLNIQSKKVPIRSPRKSWIIRQSLLILV